MNGFHPKNNEYLERVKKWKEEGRLMEEGFFEEFPFLRKFIYILSCLPKSPPHQYYVSRIESSLLNYRPIQLQMIPFFGKTTYEYVWFLSEKGGVIDVGAGDCWTIGEVISRLSPKSSEEIAFVLSGFAHTNAMIIYKSPAGISVPKWIEKQIADEKEKIHAEVEAIDAEYKIPEPPEGSKKPWGKGKIENSPFWIKDPKDGVHYDDGNYRIIDPRFCDWLHKDPIPHKHDAEDIIAEKNNK